MRLYSLALCLAAGAFGQLVPATAPLPVRAKLPVVFLNGYQPDCGSSSFQSTFGIADRVLEANGEVSLFFNNCDVAGKPPIETLGQSFGQFLGMLRYETGAPVTSVDVVAHSMGGLIVRSYLSGKQTSGEFAPPLPVKIRKAIFLATPHFGTAIGSIFGLDTQVNELASGSRFVFDLGTWNQGTDDLRGLDALSMVGNAGTGVGVFGIGAAPPRSTDGVVPLTSGSIGFYKPGRTIVLGYCHNSPGIVTLAGLCPANAQGIADIQSPAQDTARAIVSFLNSSSEWQTIGSPAESNEYLSSQAGLIVAARTADDRTAAISSATVTTGSASKPLSIGSSRDTAYSDFVQAGTVALAVTSSAGVLDKSFALPAGAYSAITAKPGPFIARVYPAASAVFPLVLAPREIVSIYGDNLAGAQARIGSTPLNLTYTSPNQINAILPEVPPGLAKLTVDGAQGAHTVNVMIEPVSPAIFTQDGSGTGPASALNSRNYQIVSPSNALRAADYLILYLTGLGETRSQDGYDVAVVQPSVTVGGSPCQVSFAGRAPGFPGLDQMNCLIPAGLKPGKAAVQVTAGDRTSNVAVVDVQ